MSSSTPSTSNQTEIELNDFLDEIEASATIITSNNESEDENEPLNSCPQSLHTKISETTDFAPIDLSFAKKFSRGRGGKLSRDDFDELLSLKITEAIVYREKNKKLQGILDRLVLEIKNLRTRLADTNKHYFDLQLAHDLVMRRLRDLPNESVQVLKVVRDVGLQVYQQEIMPGIIPTIDLSEEEIDCRNPFNRSPVKSPSPEIAPIPRPRARRRAELENRQKNEVKKITKPLMSLNSTVFEDSSEDEGRNRKKNDKSRRKSNKKISEESRKNKNSASKSRNDEEFDETRDFETHRQKSQKKSKTSAKTTNEKENDTFEKSQNKISSNGVLRSSEAQSSENESQTVDSDPKINDIASGSKNQSDQPQLKGFEKVEIQIASNKRKSGKGEESNQDSSTPTKRAKIDKDNLSEKSFEVPTSIVKPSTANLPFNKLDILENLPDAAEKFSRHKNSTDEKSKPNKSTLKSPIPIGKSSTIHQQFLNPSKPIEDSQRETSLPLASSTPPLNSLNSSSNLSFPSPCIQLPPPLPSKPYQFVKPNSKKIPPQPKIDVKQAEKGIKLLWNIEGLDSNHADMLKYEIYAYDVTSGIKNDGWKVVGEANALLLPMAVTLSQFGEGQKFYFAVRGIDCHRRFTEFSEAKSWE